MRECISQVEQLMVKVEDLQKVEEDAPSQTKHLISKVCKVKQIKTFKMRLEMQVNCSKLWFKEEEFNN
jgi:hypothetical protein